MVKRNVIGSFGFSMALFVGSVGVQAQNVTQGSSSTTAPSLVQTAKPASSFPNVVVNHSTPQDYAEHMKALQQRQDISNAKLPEPKTQATSVAPAPGDNGAKNSTPGATAR